MFPWLARHRESNPMRGVPKIAMVIDADAATDGCGDNVLVIVPEVFQAPTPNCGWRRQRL